MIEDDSPPKSSEETNEESDRLSIRDVAGKARNVLSNKEGISTRGKLALGGAVLASAAAFAAYEGARPNSHPKPELKNAAAADILMAEKALAIGAKRPTANRLAYGMNIVLSPGTVFLNPGGKEKKYIVPSESVAVVENPRFIVTSDEDEPEKPVYLAAKYKNLDYLITVPQVYKDVYNGKEGFLSTDGRPVPLGQPRVNSANNLEFGNVPTDQLSVIKFVEIPTLKKMETEQRLRPTTPTAGR